MVSINKIEDKTCENDVIKFNEFSHHFYHVKMSKEGWKLRLIFLLWFYLRTDPKSLPLSRLKNLFILTVHLGLFFVHLTFLWISKVSFELWFIMLKFCCFHIEVI